MRADFDVARSEISTWTVGYSEIHYPAAESVLGYLQTDFLQFVKLINDYELRYETFLLFSDGYESL